MKAYKKEIQCEKEHLISEEHSSQRIEYVLGLCSKRKYGVYEDLREGYEAVCSKEVYENPDHVKPSKPCKMSQLLGIVSASNLPFCCMILEIGLCKQCFSFAYWLSIKLSQQRLLEGYCKAGGERTEASFLFVSCSYQWHAFKASEYRPVVAVPSHYSS